MIRALWQGVKNFLPRTFYGRSLLILSTPLILVQVITTYMFFDLHWQKMGNRLAFGIAGEIVSIARQIERDDTPAHIAQIQQDINTLTLTIFYQKDGRLAQIYYQDQSRWQNPSRANVIIQTLAEVFLDQLDRPFYIKVAGDEKVVEVTVQLQSGVLKIQLPERRIFSSSGYIVLLWMAGSSIVLLFIAILFMRNQIRPIRRLAIAAERFGKGRDVPFFKIEGAYEVRQASKAFLKMRDRLQRQIQQRTAMLAGVSHDLRTPLTRMRLQAEMMPKTGDSEALKNDLADMEKMIEAYLQFARGEGGEQPVLADLNALIDRVAQSLDRSGQRITIIQFDPIVITIRFVAFERCMANLLGNALKYGTHAWIEVTRDGDRVDLVVDDDGPGIPPAQYEDVFKPFFRGEASRNVKTGGVGLGLPIVQDIVLTHGGTIVLGVSPQGGLRVKVSLPV